MPKQKRDKWYWALLLQVLSFFTVAAACVLVPLLFDSAALERAVQLAVLPLLGGVSAYMATRHGLNNYAAVVAPPMIMPVAYLLFTGAPPYHIGGIFLCALMTIVGASAGEVVNMRKKAGGK